MSFVSCLPHCVLKQHLSLIWNSTMDCSEYYDTLGSSLNGEVRNIDRWHFVGILRPYLGTEYARLAASEPQGVTWLCPPSVRVTSHLLPGCFCMGSWGGGAD